MNIRALIAVQSSLIDTSGYDFNLPSGFNTLSDDVYSEALSSKRNGAKYIAKPYTLCGEVNIFFYSHYLPFKKEFRVTP